MQVIRRAMVSACLLGLVMGPAQEARAQDPIHKMGRGVVNVLTCWIELPRKVSQGWEEKDPLLGVGAGLVRGSGLAVARLALGAYEAVSFLIPLPQGYASPYAGMELPDYAWE